MRSIISLLVHDAVIAEIKPARSSWNISRIMTFSLSRFARHCLLRYVMLSQSSFGIFLTSSSTAFPATLVREKLLLVPKNHINLHRCVKTYVPL